MSMVKTDLIGEYVRFPNDGDAGWIRAVYVVEHSLRVLIQRDNVSKDFRAYYAYDMELPKDEP